LRVVARRPGFAATLALTLALGIGASSTVFSLIDAVLLRPLPYPDSERLVALHETKLADPGYRTPVAPGRLEDWQRLSAGFADVSGSYQDTLTDTTGPAPERLSAAFTAPRFFAVMGTAPALGRVFTAEEEGYGGPLAAIVSDELWRRRFGADPGALGRTLMLSGQSYAIVGVMPPPFQYPAADTEVWAPKQAPPDLLRTREARFCDAIARLKPGVTVERARTTLAAAQARLDGEYPKTDAGWSVAVEPLRDALVGGVRAPLWLLLGAVGLLLAIACANVACLLLARFNSRAPEIAARISFGAARAAIARQLFAEGLVYAFTGGMLGLGAALAGIDFLRTRLPEIPRIAELRMDARAVAAVAGITLLAAVLFALAPILQTARRDLTGALILGGRGMVGGRKRLPRILVAAQFALATALLIGAGLSIRSLTKLQETPLGFHPERVLALRVGASFGEAPGTTIARHQRLLDALASVPGVTAVSVSSGLPGVDPAWPREFEIEGEPSPDGTVRFATWRIVTAGYFQTLGIPVTEGRTCRMNTDPLEPFEALVNRSFAARYLRGREAIGRTIRGGPQGDAAARIVGVVADAREDAPGSAPQPLIYACGYLRYWPDSDFLVQARDPAALVNAARTAVQSLEPARPVYSVRPLTQALRGALEYPRQYSGNKAIKSVKIG